ncbi:hypothetical protein [Ralstonia sp. UBA689]|uniref:hypothetical protein n=1 Tax=Ralstonia sp. UBA689 TaxID=1947373 RepID=UPI0025DA87BF|nr:hypothetical protein [Ralstonia sp. UBA689]
MKGTYGDRLQHALTIAKRTRQELAAALHISEQAIGQVLLGNTKALVAENSARAARFLGVDHFWLATGEGEPVASTSAPTTSWPFSRVNLVRVTQLPAEELAFVEAKLESEIERAEERSAAAGAKPSAAAFPDAGTAPTDAYLVNKWETPPAKRRKKSAA